MPHAKPPGGVDDAAHENPQRRPRGRPDRHGRRGQREQPEDGEDAAGREERARPTPPVTDGHPQPVVADRRQQHPGKHQEVGGGEHRAPRPGRALLLEVGLQRHVEHAGPDAEHRQPEDRRHQPQRRRRLAAEDVGRGEGQRPAGDGHHQAARAARVRGRPSSRASMPRLESRPAIRLPAPIPPTRRDQQRHDLPLAGRRRSRRRIDRH